MTVSAILLAAGESRRMGDLNKLELPIAGMPMLHRTVKTLLASQLGEVVVVTGHQRERIEPLIEGLPVTRVHNKDYQESQMSSVHAGLEALSRPCDGVMICLSDQPLLTPEDINVLVAAFADSNASVLVPTYHGQRGNPIILSYRHREAIIEGNRNLGCKRFIEHNPHLVTAFEMVSDHVVVDIDTSEDYAALQIRMKS